jgi:hypothetical protein
MYLMYSIFTRYKNLVNTLQQMMLNADKFCFKKLDHNEDFLQYVKKLAANN